MAEAHSTLPSSSASGLRHKLGSLGNDMFSAIEAILDPAILAASLWFVGIYIEGGLFPPYVILSVIIFSITFPGTSRLECHCR
jgi:putative colanic acid biosynthesis UDP-glucose lipid carrier transferase